MLQISIFRLWAVSVLMIAGWLAAPAQADGIGADCVRQGGATGDLVYQYVPSAAVSLPNNAPRWEPVGPWMFSNDAVAWRCTPLDVLASGTTLRLSVQGYSPYIKDGVITVDGDAYGIYRTRNAPLGYIARWRFSANGQVSDWQPLTARPAAYQTPATAFDIPYNGGQPFNLGVDVAIRLVKITSTLVPGAVAVFDPMYVRHYQKIGDGRTSEGSGTYRIAQVRSSTVNVVAGGTCTTPNQDVRLMTDVSTSFSGVGSVAGTQPFTLSFNNCPAGMNRIGYRFTPTTTVLDAANGVVALDGSATATGVGIQLADGQGQPVEFGTLYWLQDYNSLQVQSYRVPMQASLYQTEPAVSGGSVSSAITFTMDYR